MGIVWRLFGNDARSGVCHNPFIAFLLSEALEEKLQKLQKRKNGENDGQIDEALRKLNKLLCLCYKVVCAQDKILCGDISIFGKTNIKRSPSKLIFFTTIRIVSNQMNKLLNLSSRCLKKPLALLARINRQIGYLFRSLSHRSELTLNAPHERRGKKK